MEFFDISFLGTMYWYTIKIKKMFKQNKRDFGFVNLKNKGQSQGGMTQVNLSKMQENNTTTKLKKDIVKWCDFHKSPTHNIVLEVKYCSTNDQVANIFTNSLTEEKFTKLRFMVGVQEVVTKAG